MSWGSPYMIIACGESGHRLPAGPEWMGWDRKIMVKVTIYRDPNTLPSCLHNSFWLSHRNSAPTSSPDLEQPVGGGRGNLELSSFDRVWSVFVVVVRCNGWWPILLLLLLTFWEASSSMERSQLFYRDYLIDDERAKAGATKSLWKFVGWSICFKKIHINVVQVFRKRQQL